MQLRLPKLHAVTTSDDFKSIPTFAYNCVGFAIGDVHWWDPSGVDGTAWPGDLARDDSVETFLELFRRWGFYSCDNSSYEAGYEKLAVFGIDGLFEHVAIQVSDNLWISKLGNLEDIQHPLMPMEGSQYGNICHYLKRDLKRDGPVNRAKFLLVNA
ncbi:MAG: hypothetical protein ABSB33_08360 [Tepidisphaeraceae bacterium]|jgi:hypothetical protein